MAIEATTTPVRSRRAVIAAGLGGIAAVVAHAIGRPAPVRAGVDGDVVLGSSNAETTPTYITNSTSGSEAFRGSATGTGTGVLGLTSGTGVGVYGQSNGGGTGVFGYTPGGGRAIWGVGYNDAPGVVGSTSTAPGGPSSIPTKTGVFGWSNQAGGRGIHGQATGAGIGVFATAPAAGVALRANGKVKFSRSGKSKILAGHSSKTISLSGVTSDSLVFAVLRSNRTGRWVRAVVPGSGSFTVRLNTSVLSDSYIVWFVLN